MAEEIPQPPFIYEGLDPAEDGIASALRNCQAQ